MLKFVRKDDTVIVHSMDRLARNLSDLLHLVQSLTARGVVVEFLKERLVFTGEDAPVATLMLSVMGAVAEFERTLIRERQREGIALAKKKGVYRGRRPTLRPQQIEELRKRVDAGEPKVKVAESFGISRQSLYRILRESEPQHES